MRRVFLTAIVATALAAACPATAEMQTAGPTAWGVASADAAAFMEAYGRDLRAGDREAIIERYDPEGVWMVSAGRGEHLSSEQVGAVYRSDEWKAPQAFDWQNLVFIPSGTDAMTVTGRFVWTRETGVARTIAYHALLSRTGGQWRIRVEDETPVSAPR